MKRTMLITILLPILAFFTGCAKFRCWQTVPFPNQQVKIENPQMARIYLMRDTVLGDESNIMDGNTYIGRMTAHRYLCWEREPGKAVIKTMYGATKKKTPTLELSVEAGKTYYIHEHSFFPLVKLELISETEGMQRLARCYPPNNITR